MKNLDASIDYEENARFNYLYKQLVHRMVRETGFTHHEVTSLLMIYHKFVLKNGQDAQYMSKSQLRECIECMFDIRDPHILVAISELSRSFDTRATAATDKQVSPAAFLKLFGVFFTSSLEDRIRFAFSLYDRHHVGYLNRDLIVHVVEHFFSGDDEDELIELRSDMVELIFRKFDLDKDMQISFNEYAAAVRAQPTLLQFLGTCFPNPRHMDTASLCANLVSWYGKKL